MPHLKHSSFITQSYYCLPKSEQRSRVPKNGVSGSKLLLKPQPLLHQYWGLELRTSLYGSEDNAQYSAKCDATVTPYCCQNKGSE
jgi:hypothetical protein